MTVKFVKGDLLADDASEAIARPSVMRYQLLSKEFTDESDVR